MKSLLYVLTALSVIGLAFWAYHENYRTQDAIARAETLQRGIRDARDKLTMLRADWAYLNRPDRLRELAEINYDRLKLLPFRPDQFGRIEELAYPPAKAFGLSIDLSKSVNVSSDSEEPFP